MRLTSVLLLLLLLPGALAATLHGTIYREDLSVARQVLVTIDTQPQQRLLSMDGAYSFEVPPGNYTLAMSYAQAGRNLTVAEDVSVAQEGSFAFDLFLLPTTDEQDRLYDELNADLAANFQEIADVPDAPARRNPWPLVVLILFLAAVVIVPWLYLRRRFRKLDAQHAPEPSARLEEILAIVRKEGGRISQRELRRRLPESEAKVSLMIAELVAEGKLGKIKAGRSNILTLK